MKKTDVNTRLYVNAKRTSDDNEVVTVEISNPEIYIEQKEKTKKGLQGSIERLKAQEKDIIDIERSNNASIIKEKG